MQGQGRPTRSAKAKKDSMYDYECVSNGNESDAETSVVEGTCGARSRRAQSDMDQSWEMFEERERESNLEILKAMKVKTKKTSKTKLPPNIVRTTVEGRTLTGVSVRDVLLETAKTKAEITKHKLDKTVGDGGGDTANSGTSNHVGEGGGNNANSGVSNHVGEGEGTIQILGSANKSGSEF